MNKKIEIPEPTVAPLGVEITRDEVREVWDTFVKPDQDAGNVQSIEMRILTADSCANTAAHAPNPRDTRPNTAPGTAHGPSSVEKETAMNEQEWVLKLLGLVIRHEDEHAYQVGCLHAALTDVPADAYAAAEVYDRYVTRPNEVKKEEEK